MAEFSPKFLAAQKEKLLAERERLHGEKRAIDQDLIQLGRSQADDGASVGNHMADEGGSIQEADNDLAVRGNVEQVLAEVEHALKKLEDGTYGICEDTGEPISQARLEALPYARYTVAALEKREAARYLPPDTEHPVAPWSPNAPSLPPMCARGRADSISGRSSSRRSPSCWIKSRRRWSSMPSGRPRTASRRRSSRMCSISGTTRIPARPSASFRGGARRCC